VQLAPGVARLVSIEDTGGSWRVSGEIRKDVSRVVLGEQ
jgi:hypothetical protein